MSQQTHIMTESTLKSVLNLVDKTYIRHKDADKMGKIVKDGVFKELKPYCQSITNELSAEAKDSVDKAQEWATQAKEQTLVALDKAKEASEYAERVRNVLTEAQELKDATANLQTTISKIEQRTNQALKDFNKVKESLSSVVNYRGAIENYSDLPTENHIGDMYNVKNTDKAHECKAGDNVVWNGEDWDNMGGSIDVEDILGGGKNAVFGSVRADTITATTFNGTLEGKATTAGVADSANSVDWGKVQDKPATFEPSAHSHSWSSITNKPIAFTPASHTHTWNQISDRPNSLPASGGTSTNTDKINITCNNELVLNRNGQNNGGTCWIGYRNEGATAAITEYRMGDGLAKGGLANVTAKTFNGSLKGNADTATNADKLDGLHLNEIYSYIGGRKQPTLTPILKKICAWHSGSGTSYTDVATATKNICTENERNIPWYTNYDHIYLTQDFTNFEKVLFIFSDGGNHGMHALWESWMLLHAIKWHYRFGLFGEEKQFCAVYGAQGNNHPASNTREFFINGCNVNFSEIYGINY